MSPSAMRLGCAIPQAPKKLEQKISYWKSRPNTFMSCLPWPTYSRVLGFSPAFTETWFSVIWFIILTVIMPPPSLINWRRGHIRQSATLCWCRRIVPLMTWSCGRHAWCRRIVPLMTWSCGWHAERYSPDIMIVLNIPCGSTRPLVRGQSGWNLAIPCHSGGGLLRGLRLKEWSPCTSPVWFWMQLNDPWHLIRERPQKASMTMLEPAWCGHSTNKEVWRLAYSNRQDTIIEFP
jgi:hypothetical protein